MTRHKILRNTCISLAVILVAIFGAILFAGYVEDAGCRIDVVKAQSSPDGKYVARAIVKDCGATTDFSPQVRIRRSGIPFSERKAFWGYRTRNVNFEWNGDSALNIYSDCKKENIFLLRKKVYSVNINAQQGIAAAGVKD